MNHQHNHLARVQGTLMNFHDGPPADSYCPRPAMQILRHTPHQFRHSAEIKFVSFFMPHQLFRCSSQPLHDMWRPHSRNYTTDQYQVPQSQPRQICEFAIELGGSEDLWTVPA